MRFLHFTLSGKTSLPVDSDRLYMYIVISRAITKKITLKRVNINKEIKMAH